MRDHMPAELTVAALTMAIQRQKPPPGLIHHSDRGSQYATADYREVLDAAGMIQSHEPEGKLLGQCPDGKLLWHDQNRTRAPGMLPNAEYRPPRIVQGRVTFRAHSFELACAQNLKGLTPYEAIRKVWTKEPERFTFRSKKV